MLTIRELIKTLYNAFNQKLKNHRGNWDQNDPTADDYIKNRPFYTDDTNKTVIIPKQKVSVNTGEMSTSSALGHTVISISPIIPLVEGETYEVIWDGKKYTCLGQLVEGFVAIGNGRIFETPEVDMPFLIAIDKDIFGGAFICAFTGTHTVEILATKVVKIDKKYLPDIGLKADDLAPVAISGNYWDLEDLPEIPNDVVRYNDEIWLSTSQKNTALKNIGAISYESQSLNVTQKAQARTNIGAGDGNYNSLTNKPTIYTDVIRYTVSQGLTEAQKEMARKNIDAGKVDATLTISGLAADSKATGDAISGLAADSKIIGNTISDIQTTLNTFKDGITFHDQVTGYNYILCVRDGNIVTYSAIKELEVTTLPTQTEYIAGEYLIPDGMIISATAFDGTTKEITGWTVNSDSPLDETKLPIVTYVEAGITYTVEVPIVINPFDPEKILVDFIYTDNNNGTYTLTEWKQTLNGTSSTEMIIPNNSKIIL